MTACRKRLLRTAGILTIAMTIVICLMIGALRSAAFADLVRARCVAYVATTTGGQVELTSFRFDWSHLAVEMRGLTVHGLENRNGPSLLYIPEIRAVFPLSALLRRKAVMRSLELVHPDVHLSVSSNGLTNLPHPRAVGPDILSVQLKRFACVDGTLTVNWRRVNLDVGATDLSLDVEESHTRGTYKANITSSTLTSTKVPGVVASLSARATVNDRQLKIETATLRSATSWLSVTGRLANWTNLHADLDAEAVLYPTVLRTFAPLEPLTAGTLTWRGGLRYQDASLSASGTLSGNRLSWRLPKTTLTGVSFTSSLTASQGGVRVEQLRINSPNGAFAGRAQVSGWRQVDVAGTASAVDVMRLVRLVLPNRMLCSGVASGEVRLQFALATEQSLAVDADLTIKPGRGARPISGDVVGHFQEPGDVLDLQSLHVHLAGADIAASGRVGKSLQIHLQSTDVAELQSFLEPALDRQLRAEQIKLAGTEASFDGSLLGSGQQSELRGSLRLQHFSINEDRWREAQANVELSQASIAISRLLAVSDSGRAEGSISAQLRHWSLAPTSPLSVAITFDGLNVEQFAASHLHLNVPVIHGTAQGRVLLNGSLEAPQGTVVLRVDSVDTLGQRLNRAEATVEFDGAQAHISQGQIAAGSALMEFHGDYSHQHDNWMQGRLHLFVKSNGFPLSSLSEVHSFAPDVAGILGLDGETTLLLAGGHVSPEKTKGHLRVYRLTYRNVPYGDAAANITTEGDAVQMTVSSTLGAASLTGVTRVLLNGDNLVEGTITARQVGLAQVTSLLEIGHATIPGAGTFDGTLQFGGPLHNLGAWQARAEMTRLAITASLGSHPVALRNAEPVVLRFANGTAHVDRLQMTSGDASIRVSGSAEYRTPHHLDLTAEGTAQLRMLEYFGPGFTSDGAASGRITIGGTLQEPVLSGRIQLKSASAYFQGLANGITNVNGAVRFNGTRATVENLTAETGGGRVSLAGFVTFSPGSSAAYNFTARADNVRVRAAGAISVTAGASLQLTGTTQAGLVAGDVTVQRVVVSPETDLGSVLAVSARPVVEPKRPGDLLSGLRFDVAIQSASDLQISTAASRDVEANLDLRLRGTPDRPILFGSINANQGTLRIFGAKYTLNRGEVTFTNAARIEPVLNLDLQTVARGVAVDITVTGTMSKLSMNYRSDPPLQPKDIIALLTVGKAPTFSSTSAGSQPATGDVSALQAGVNTVLGQAISPSSNGLSKLFGITNIKIDPLVQGITNTPQSRLTVEQQISQNVTVTYVTNLAQTSEQIFRFEWALNPRYSVVAIRDDNGEFGIDIQFKKRFK